MVKEDTMLQPYICNKFKKIRFSRKIGKNAQLLELLSKRVQEEVEKPFIKARHVLME